MKDWYFKRQLKSCNECVDLYTTRISDFVFRRRRCRFPNSLIYNHEPRASDYIFNTTRPRVLKTTCEMNIQGVSKKM